MNEPTAPQSIPTDCPRCGRPMLLELPADADPSDAQRLALLVLCDACTAGHSCALEPSEPPPICWPVTCP